MKFVVRTLITAAAVALASVLIQGISVGGATSTDKIVTLIAVALVIGLLNALIKPIIKALTGCIVWITFGLFLLVINAVILMLASWLAQSLGFGFHVDGFWPALFGSIVISVVSAVGNGLVGTERRDA